MGWHPAGQVEFGLGQPQTFNVAPIQENIALGERVQVYRVEVLDGGKWRGITAGRIIGYKQLRRFPAVTARLLLAIDQAYAPPAIEHDNPTKPRNVGTC